MAAKNSDHKRDEELRKSEEQHRTILQTALNGIWLTDKQGRLLEVNDAYSRMSGYSKQELLTMCISDLEVSETAEETAARIKRIAVLGEDRFESRHRRKDGSIFDVEVGVQHRPSEDGRMVAFLHDITDRKRAEVDLRRSSTDLHALAARLQDVREQERASLSRELHDNLGQHLTAFALQFESVCMESRALADGSSALALLCDKITGMTPLVERLIEQTQSICAMLRPGVLDELGLVAALEWLADKTEKRTGLIITTSLPAEDIELDRDIALALFRIAQEALANVARHARAARAEIRLHASGGMWELEIQDNGQGFTPSSRVGPMALGLLGMRERAGAFGGTVDFLSETGKGATVRVRVPGGARSAMKGERV